MTKVLSDLAAHNKPYVLASALLGVTGLRKVVLNSVVSITGRKFEVFDSDQKAKDWLTGFSK